MIPEEADLRVEIVKVKDVTPMEGKDRIELVWFYNKAPNGEPCIVQKDKFEQGDLACYIPPDHVVPDVGVFKFLERHPEKLCPDELWIRHKHRRVKAMKMSGYISHGLAITLHEMDICRIEQDGLGIPTSLRSVGSKPGAEMGVKRYEPKRTGGTGVKGSPMGTEKGPRGLEVPKYDLTGIRKLADIFMWNSGPSPLDLIVTEKLHGCNARFIVTDDIKHWWSTLWTRLVDFVCRRPPTMELFHNGKMKLHLASRTVWRGTAANHKSIWKEVAEKLAIFSKLKKIPDAVVYGEIIGRRVQGGNFLYGTSNDDVAFYVFDIYNPREKAWMSWDDLETTCARIGLQTVPVIACGPLARDETEILVDGVSIIDGLTMREGVVIRTNTDMRTPSGGRMIMKWKSELFLQKHG